MTDRVYARINEEAFRELVAGKVVTLRNTSNGTMVKLILEDIGWGRMLDAIAAAVGEQMKGKPRDEVLQVLQGFLSRGRDGRETPP
jgi:hypothetical protein